MDACEWDEATRLDFVNSSELATAEKPPSESPNGKSHSPRNETAAPETAADPPRVTLALNAVDRMMRDARIVRTFEIAIARGARAEPKNRALR